MTNMPKSCKKENRLLAFSIGMSLMKEIEKKSFQKGAYQFNMPFGEFQVIVVRSK